MLLFGGGEGGGIVGSSAACQCYFHGTGTSLEACRRHTRTCTSLISCGICVLNVAGVQALLNPRCPKRCCCSPYSLPSLSPLPLTPLSPSRRQIPTLDGRVLRVPVSEIVTPGYVKVVSGEGMPLPGGGGKGNLRIVFSLIFPGSLSARSAELVKAGLLLPPAPTKEALAAVDALSKAFHDKQKGWSLGKPPASI